MEIRDTRNGDWHWVYNALLADPHLTIADKLVYSSISTFGGHQVIHPTLSQIGERCNTSERQVRYSLKRLKEVGYISIKESTGRGNANVYYLLKMAKGCKLCPFYKGGKEEQERGQIETIKGEPTAPHIDIYKDKQIDKSNTDSSLKEKNEDYEHFLIWYKFYPNKVGKPAAYKAWKKIKPDTELKRKMVTMVLEHCKSKQWQKKEFIPYPATWLNQERWNDTLPQAEE